MTMIEKEIERESWSWDSDLTVIIICCCVAFEYANNVLRFDVDEIVAVHDSMSIIHTK